MGIKRFFDQDVTVQRLRSIGGDKKSFQSTATVESHIQGLGDEARQALGIIEERAWRAWFDVDVDLNENDRITDKDGVVYVVREITKKDYAFGINQHVEAILVEISE